ncbi:MAG: S49 family peptidase, partial [Rhodospirillaceae bacterium]|nr:S49 family peptidase [Rhodospirillaceae bacterium]
MRLNGAIGNIGPLRRGMNIQRLAPAIQRAFSVKGLKAVALSVNSPGGSAVQSALIYRRIRDLANEKNVPVLVFVEDVAASGGYWLACAGDEIFADANSIIGSIGVVTGGFGFVEAIGKLGIERRVYTAGARKAMLDPFRPENEDDVAHLKTIQKDMHDSFIDLVQRRRGKKLKGDGLFTGEFWTGRKALELGLVDALGDMRSVCRDRFGEKVRLVVIGERRSWFKRRFGLAGERAPQESWGIALGAGLLAAVEERALGSRFVR